MTRTSRRRSNSFNRIAPLVFLLGGCLCLTLALGVFGATVLFRAGDSVDASVWKPPLELVDNRALAPGTVLLPLTGVSATDALAASLDQAHLENAYALLAYDLDLNDAARIGAYLQLGERYAKVNDAKMATSAYQSAALLATLSPALSDQTRLEAYLQASGGLRALGASGAARFVTDQAYLMAQYSSSISRDVRVRRLNQIAEAYAALGANSLAGQVRAKVIDINAAPSENTSAVARPLFASTLAKLPAAPPLDQATKARIEAAKQLASDIKDLKIDAKWNSDSLAQLSDALLNEDDQRQAYYDQQIAQAKDPTLQLALWNDKAHWLALKYRIARGAFGKDIVADWGKDQSTIASALTEAFDNLMRLTEAQAGASKTQNPALATEFVVRQELMLIRWGWWSADEQGTRDNMDNLNQQLMNSPLLAWHLDAITRNKKIDYILLPDDLYGQGESALPK